MQGECPSWRNKISSHCELGEYIDGIEWDKQLTSLDHFLARRQRLIICFIGGGYYPKVFDPVQQGSLIWCVGKWEIWRVETFPDPSRHHALGHITFFSHVINAHLHRDPWQIASCSSPQEQISACIRCSRDWTWVAGKVVKIPHRWAYILLCIWDSTGNSISVFHAFLVCDPLGDYNGCFLVWCLSCFPVDQAWNTRKATCSFPDAKQLQEGLLEWSLTTTGTVAP